MLEVILIRPGSTTFDEEGRIKGALDIPLSRVGEQQALSLSKELQTIKLDCLYVSPCESAQMSAKAIGERSFCRIKTLGCLRNLDHGLWQGKTVAEVKRLQPRVYRQFQEHPTEVCPPEGETISAAIERIQNPISRLLKKHRGGRVGILVPEPLATIVRFSLVGGSFGDLWKSEMDFGTFERIEIRDAVPTQSVVLSPA